MAESRLLLAGQNHDALQAKFRAPGAPLAAWWPHFLILARNNPFWFSSYSVLAFLVTGEDGNRRQARDLFLRFTRAKDAGLLSKEVQFHTHAVAAPLGRMLALYDWIVETDLLTADEHAAFRAAALDFAAQAPLQQLQGRARMFDNQVFSNAFGAALTGYVLGVRRGDSALGRRLYAVGMEWLLDQFGRLPAACYSGEGSTYHMLVVAPLLTLAGAFVEEVAGLPVYDRGVAPALCPLRDWLRMARDLVGPAGLLPGWDAYGVFQSPVRAPLTYLARRDRDADALALIRDTHMWYPFAHTAWDFDDRLWTLVWWPADLAAAPTCAFPAWMNSAAAGALQDARTGTRLFQYWDECGGGPYNGRCNVNPNAIELQTGGLPVLLDGLPAVPPELLNVDEAAILRYLPEGVMQGLRRAWGLPDTAASMSQVIRYALGGAIGDSNSLVVDRENWYVPLKPVAGKGIALHAAGGLQVIESEAADYYRDRYDVTHVTRTSALIDGRVVLCLDDWGSRTPHQLTWQAFTWPNAAGVTDGVRADIGGQLQLDVLAGQPGRWNLTAVPGFPRSPCKASTRLEFHLPAPVAETRLVMGLVVQDRLGAGEDISGGWSLEREGGPQRAGVDLTTFHLTDESPSGTVVTLRRRFEAPAAGAAQSLFLRVPSAALSLQVHVNGRPAALLFDQETLEVQGSTSTYAQVFAIGPLCRGGANELTLTVRTFHGESLRGPVTLHRGSTPEAVALASEGPDQWAVRIGAQTHRVLLGSRGPRTWQGGRTDARHALLAADGELALAGVCVAEFAERGLAVKANLPVDLSIHGATVTFGVLPLNAHVVVRLPGGWVAVSSMTVLQASCALAGATLRFRLDEARECFFNGRAVGRRGGPGDRLVEWTVTPVPGRGSVGPVQTADDVYRVADEAPPDLTGRLDAWLRSGDWRIRMAAADVAGKFDMQGLVPLLLQLLADEEAQPPHPPLTRTWSETKMVHALVPGVDCSVDQTIDPVEGTKRYRLKRALITALGRLGDARAVAPLEQIMRRGTDFFPALAQVPVALARLGQASSIAALDLHWDHGEINVRTHVRLALSFLRGEIPRSEFEARVNPA